MKVNDKVQISPDLTLMSEWINATIIKVENNSFVGIVISAKTDDGLIYFSKEYMFKQI